MVRKELKYNRLFVLNVHVTVLALLTSIVQPHMSLLPSWALGGDSPEQPVESNEVARAIDRKWRFVT
jgi:hypothetical protein